MKVTNNFSVVQKALSAGRRNLTEPECLELLKAVGVPTLEHILAKNAEEAATVAKTIGFPVVMKIVSPDIVHKSDAGCVLVGVDSQDRVAGGFGMILENARRFRSVAQIEGILIEKMAKPGQEVIIG